MAFETATTKIGAVREASAVLDQLRSVRNLQRALQQALATYQAGNNPALTAAFNALFSAPERQELASMITELTALISGWESTHSGAIGV